MYPDARDARAAIEQFDGANANGQPITLALVPPPRSARSLFERVDGAERRRRAAAATTDDEDDYEDEYYGVQGTTWDNPPILSSPAGTKVVNGRKLFLYKDGSRLTQVAWHHDGDAYWISNNLTENLPNSQMLEIAASLTRYNG